MDLDLKPNMKINITQKAMEFLQKANKREFYIERFVVSQCCIPLSTPPTVRKGGSRKLENFYVFDVDGITVYYDRNLIQKKEITVDAQGSGFSKVLQVTDWVIKY